MDSCPETLWKAVKPNMDSFDEVFAAVKEYCKEHVVIATYNLFINDIEPVSYDGNKAVLSVRSEYVKNTLENSYLSLLQEAAESAVPGARRRTGGRCGRWKLCLHI